VKIDPADPEIAQGKGGAMLTPMNSFLLWGRGGLHLCQFW